MQNRRSYVSYILLAVFVLAGALYLLRPLLISNRNESVSTENGSAASSTAPAATEGGVVKEGEVVFLKGGKKFRKIDVEIAENETERQKGLMFRPYLSDSVGMLFVFEQAVPQSFWMKNTMISLDIIYVDQNKKIVSIQKRAKPYSEESLPSFGDAQYVVEVNGGYCDKYGIQVGDAITF
ncbi:DUF192 domain-containing protein [Runella sp.]|uniref:DUF192 domain-containing protein n=1 Tax=Runella sp. TaxID=1960881 RepID=UPI003D0BE92E